MTDRLVLASGLEIHCGLDRLRRFCAEEHPYYDAIPSRDPHRIEPEDVLVTVAVNSFVNHAARVRSVHRGLAAECGPLLAGIPEDADLRSCDPGVVEALLAAACRVHGVLVPVATKVLHRKRRLLIPMLDSVLIDAYRRVGVAVSGAALQDGRRAAAAVMPVLEAFSNDLRAAWDPLTRLGESLREASYPLTTLRILETLIWIHNEPRGYYRNEVPGESR